MKKLLIAFCCILGTQAFGQSDGASTFIPRLNYGARLEITDKVIHGAGQDSHGFAAYWQALEEGKKPAMSMYYTQLRGNLKSDFANFRKDLQLYEDRYKVYLIAQIGLAMTNDGSPETCYDQAVAAGTYDQAIETLCQAIAELGHPVLLRIGYEFNGVAWNGYHPEAYKKAFVKISKALRDHKLEAAAVWDAAGEIDFLGSLDRYYPGDEWVDWWGINLFSGKENSNTNIFKHPLVNSFMKEAQNHKKPVLIGESTPRYIGVLKGEESWKTWYREYFSFMDTWPGVKAFSYINWDWSKFPMWQNWGDARIGQNQYIKTHYNAELGASQYIHAFAEKNYRILLGSTDGTVDVPANFRAVWSEEKLAPILAWESMGKNILRYEILLNGVKVGSTNGLSFIDSENAGAGKILNYTVRAVNDLGDPGESTSAHTIVVPKVLTKIKSDFIQGPEPWTLAVYNGASGRLSLDDGSQSGKKSARLEISNGKGSNWFMQFLCPLQVFKGKTYTLTFTAWADQTKLPAEVWIQQTHEPFGGIISAWQFSPGKTPKTFTVQATASHDDSMNLSFMLGKITSHAVVWLEDITLVEE